MYGCSLAPAGLGPRWLRNQKLVTTGSISSLRTHMKSHTYTNESVEPTQAGKERQDHAALKDLSANSAASGVKGPSATWCSLKARAEAAQGRDGGNSGLARLMTYLRKHATKLPAQADALVALLGCDTDMIELCKTRRSFAHRVSPSFGGAALPWLRHPQVRKFAELRLIARPPRPPSATPAPSAASGTTPPGTAPSRPSRTPPADAACSR